MENNMDYELEKECLERRYDLEILNIFIRTRMTMTKQLIQGDIGLITMIVLVTFLSGGSAILAFHEGRIGLGCFEVGLVLLNVVNLYITIKRLTRNIKEYRQDKKKYGAILEEREVSDNDR